MECDPEVMRFLNGGAVDHQNTDHANVTFLMPRGTEPDVWTAQRINSGVFVGWVCLSMAYNGVAEMGCRLRRDAWGKGYATEAASALIRWAFNTTDFDKLVACTLATNIGSRRVMEKIGMEHVRTVPYEGAAFPDTEKADVWYKLTRNEWGQA